MQPTRTANPRPRGARAARWLTELPPVSYFLTGAVFHYLGPSLAVLLFARLGPLGVAWWRIATAAVVLALWRRPWRWVGGLSGGKRRAVLLLGLVLAAMNAVFYLALARLPLATVGAVEFLGTVVLAAVGARTRRNLIALALAVAGVAALTELRLRSSPLGFALAFANCGGFMAYVVLGHRMATGGPATSARAGAPADPARRRLSGIDQLAVAMLVAAVAITPVGVPEAAGAFRHPLWMLWAVGVGVCSSVVPYVADQLAMARLPRASFALMLALLPASATVMGLVLLAQVPTWQDVLGVGLVVAGVALHAEPRVADA